jgi:hypoxanthine-DNA glycosylase
MSAATGFAPIAAANARILLLGTVPGAASLAAGQYYAHPRNAFWRILASITGVPHDAAYEARVAGAIAAGIALWDVLESCIRPGSLDASIVRGSLVVNDFAAFLAAHPAIARVGLNGATAAKEFRRHVLPLGVIPGDCCRQLPSTSPAHAAMRFEEKAAVWREFCLG